MSNFFVVGLDCAYVEPLVARVPGARDKLPPLKGFTEPVGEMALAGRRVPVVTGTMDAWSGAIGAGVRRPGQGVYMSGTSEIVAIASAERRGAPGIVTFPRVEGLTLNAGPLTELPAGSALEAGARTFFRAPLTAALLRRASVKQLERFERCGFRFWAERYTEFEQVWWRALVQELRSLERLNAARLEILCSSYPHAAAWLSDAEESLSPLTFGYTLENTFAEPGEGPYARLDAVGRRGDHYRLYTFVEPERFTESADAKRFVEARERLHELWATAQLLARGAASVELFVWPVLGQPLSVYGAGVVRATRQMNTRVRQAAARGAHRRPGRDTVRPGLVGRGRHHRALAGSPGAPDDEWLPGQLRASQDLGGGEELVQVDVQDPARLGSWHGRGLSDARA